MQVTCQRCGTYYDPDYGCPRCRAFQRNAEMIQNSQLAELEQRREQQSRERKAREEAKEERERQEMVSGLIAKGHSPEEARLRISQLYELGRRFEEEYRRFRFEEKQCEDERKALSLSNHIQTATWLSILTYPIHNAVTRGVVGLKSPPEPRPITCPRCKKEIVIPAYNDNVAGDTLKEHVEACVLCPPALTLPPPKQPTDGQVADTGRPTIPQREIIFFGPKHARKAPEPTKEQKLAVVDPSNPKSPFHGYQGDVKAIQPLLDSIVEALGRDNHVCRCAVLVGGPDAATATAALLATLYSQAVELPLVRIDSTFGIDADSVLTCLRRDLAGTLVPLVECGRRTYFAPPCVVLKELAPFEIVTVKGIMRASDGTTLDLHNLTWVFSTTQFVVGAVEHWKRVILVDLEAEPSRAQADATTQVSDKGTSVPAKRVAKKKTKKAGRKKKTSKTRPKKKGRKQ